MRCSCGRGRLCSASDLARDVTEGDPQLPHTDVDADGETDPAGDRDHLRPAAAAGGVAGVDDPRGEQLLDDRRDRRRGQSRRPGELDLREPAVAMDRLDDEAAVGLAQRGLRARSWPHALPRSRA